MTSIVVAEYYEVFIISCQVLIPVVLPMGIMQKEQAIVFAVIGESMGLIILVKKRNYNNVFNCNDQKFYLCYVPLNVMFI